MDLNQSETAHADRVVKVHINFIPSGFPTETILAYLEQIHDEIIGTSEQSYGKIRISDRFNIQTETRVLNIG